MPSFFVRNRNGGVLRRDALTRYLCGRKQGGIQRVEALCFLGDLALVLVV